MAKHVSDARLYHYLFFRLCYELNVFCTRRQSLAVGLWWLATKRSIGCLLRTFGKITDTTTATRGSGGFSKPPEYRALETCG
jgi:hypothetical protein